MVRSSLGGSLQVMHYVSIDYYKVTHPLMHLNGLSNILSKFSAIFDEHTFSVKMLWRVKRDECRVEVYIQIIFVITKLTKL